MPYRKWEMQFEPEEKALKKPYILRLLSIMQKIEQSYSPQYPELGK